MCNVCNSNWSTATTSSCGYSSCNNGGGSFLDSLFGGCGCNQTVCRDCNGCLRIRNRTCGCCNSCNSCNSCNCGCNNDSGNNGNDSGASGNSGNDNFACITYCGAVGNTTATTPSTTSFNAEAYYARQYGLYPYNQSRGCSACANAYLSGGYNV